MYNKKAATTFIIEYKFFMGLTIAYEVKGIEINPDRKIGIADSKDLFENNSNLIFLQLVNLL